MAVTIFDDLEFNPFDVPNGVYIFNYYTKLLRRPELYRIPHDIFSVMNEPVPSLEHLDRLVRFVVLFCSKESPYYKEQDFEKRIDLCAEVLAIQKSSNLYKMIQDNHWWVSNVVGSYMQTQNNDQFEKWLSLKSAVAELHKTLRIRIADVEDPDKHIGVKMKAVDAIDGLMQKIAETETKIFPDSKTAQMAYEAASAADERGGWAEKMAKDFKIK